MVGDALTDVQAGRRAVVGRTILLLTGRGREQLAMPEAVSLEPLEIYPDLKAVVEKGLFT
jgi:phosphoglycolate phosphatase-like HAD superfamily hydrolase